MGPSLPNDCSCDRSHQLATIIITLCRLDPMARRMVFQLSESPWSHTALGVDSAHAYFMKRELYPINYPILKQFKLPTLFPEIIRAYSELSI